jgi:hypothetical protein
MILYGKIKENGLLALEEVKERTEVRSDKKGNPEQRVITIDEQITALSMDGWMPVDTDNTTTVQPEENHIMRQVFSKKDGRIITSFEQILDTEGIKQKIDNLTKEVAATDYQVRKCQEYSLVGKAMPYDIQVIHKEAESIRGKIRELEKLLI